MIQLVIYVLYIVVVCYFVYLSRQSKKIMREQLELIQQQQKTIEEQCKLMEGARTLVEQWKDRALFAEAQLMVAKDVLKRHGFVMTAMRTEEQKDKN